VIVLTGAVLFALSMTAAPRRGILANMVRTISTSYRIANQNLQRTMYEITKDSEQKEEELKLVSFDPELTAAIGIRPALIHYLLMFMVAAFTVVSFEAVGSILVVAMLVVPSATAFLLTDRLKVMVTLSVLLGIASAVLGRQLASALETSVAGMMAVSSGGFLLLAALFSPRFGYLTRRGPR
jgi:hypothetical protein